MARRSTVDGRAQKRRVDAVRSRLREQRARASELARANQALIERAKSQGQRARTLVADLARARYRKLDYPSAWLSEALSRAGVPEDKHERRALRSLVHQVSGLPPPEHCLTNVLAQLVLEALGTPVHEP